MILLASKSPRRRELLTQIGIAFEVCESDAEELAGTGREPLSLVRENAERKSLAVAKLHPSLPVLGADTVVSLEGEIFGKPRDEEEAREMLRALSGRQHLVTTGLALAVRGELYTTAATTRVYFDELSDEEIAAYVATGEPLDKAGAYAIQGRAAAFIPRIEGSYSNVVGLPLHTLRALARHAKVTL